MGRRAGVLCGGFVANPGGFDFSSDASAAGFPQLRLMHSPGGCSGFAIASAVCLLASGVAVWCFGFCAGIRVMTYRFKRCPCAGRHLLCLRRLVGLLVFSLASALRCLPFMRRPCAGRHLLFFAAAKKSRQKKAAHTASSSFCLRAPNRSYASHGNHVTHVRCQRSCAAPHPLQPPALPHTLPDIPRPPRWQTVCRP